MVDFKLATVASSLSISVLHDGEFLGKALFDEVFLIIEFLTGAFLGVAFLAVSLPADGELRPLFSKIYKDDLK